MGKCMFISIIKLQFTISVMYMKIHIYINLYRGFSKKKKKETN